MEALKTHFNSRIRTQISNLILFGSMIAITASGLMGGMVAGVLLANHLSAIDAPAVLKLVSVLTLTIGGFAFGVFSSILASPFFLRYAFFAKEIGKWNGVTVYSAADVDLPGKSANVFVAGFSFGRGIFQPVVFVSEGAAQILSRNALEAVFAHEMSHLNCSHLFKRTLSGIGSFIAGSFLTSMTLMGLHWSGYAEIGGFFSLFAGIIPAVLTWLTIRKLAWSQEFEADARAITDYSTTAEALVEALTTLQMASNGRTEIHPLVAERIQTLQAQFTNTPVQLENEPKTAEIAA